MKENTVVLHNLDDLASYELPGFLVVARTRTRDELRQALGAIRPRVLVLDIDEPRASDAIVGALELTSELCIVGATDQRNPQSMVSAIRAGCKQLTTKPVDPNDLIVAIRRGLNVVTEIQQSGQVFGVISAIGGAGGTTLACHLALALADGLNSSALVADLDLEFGGVARAWDLSPSFTIADIAGSGTVDTMLLKKAACELTRGISVLARPYKIEEAHAIDESMIGMIIQSARGAYPFVVLDLPRKLDAVVGTALEHCSKTLIVTQATVPAVDNAKRLADALVTAGMEFEKLEFVLNRHRKNFHALTPEVIEKNLGKKLFGIIPNDFKAVSSAMDLGTPVTSRNPVYRAIAELALKMSGRSQPREQRGWLSRFTAGKSANPVG